MREWAILHQRLVRPAAIFQLIHAIQYDPIILYIMSQQVSNLIQNIHASQECLQVY